MSLCSSVSQVSSSSLAESDGLEQSGSARLVIHAVGEHVLCLYIHVCAIIYTHTHTHTHTHTQTSVHLHSLHELNQELQQLTSAMGDLTTGLDSLSHDIFSQQNLLAIANMVAIVSLSLILGVWYSCSQRKVRRDLAELKTLMVKMKSETSSGESSTNDFASSLSLATGQVLRNSHVRSSSASELNDLKSVRGIGELSQRHLRGL